MNIFVRFCKFDLLVHEQFLSTVTCWAVVPLHCAAPWPYQEDALFREV